MGIEKLDKYKQTPRELTSDFYEVYKKPPLLFGKSAFKENAEMVPLVYAYVVQAHEDFYRITHEPMFGEIVVVFSLEPKAMYDKIFLAEAAEKLIAIREEEIVSNETESICELLNDPASIFTEKLPKGLTNNVETYCATVTIDKAYLPGYKIPKDKIIALFIEEVRNERSKMIMPEGRFWI